KQQGYMQIQSRNESLSIAAVYCPPRFSISEGQFMDFYNLLGDRFIAAGDYNAKHTYWGSRLVTPRGRQLYNAIINVRNKLDFVSPGTTGHPTHYPYAQSFTPSAIDFFLFNGIRSNELSIKIEYQLSSDHLPLIVKYNSTAKTRTPTRRLLPPGTNLEVFRKDLEETLDLNLEIQSPSDI
ncbi:hypothetical protein KR067_010714, partial [Drosophila pandora]